VEIWRYRLIPIQAPLSLGVKMAKSMQSRGIPTELSLEQFRQFVLPHLTVGRRGPAPKLSLHALFNYILKLLYLGCQWKELPIAKDAEGRPEIHYTRIYGAFRRWQAGGCFDIIFTVVVLRLHQSSLLDVTIIHGDGTTTAAKKGGDNIGFNGHKRIKGDKVVAFCDRNCNVIAPFVAAPGNHSEAPLLRAALPNVMRIARSVGLELQGTIVSLDGGYDCRQNRKAIFNRGMVPNINANPRGRKSAKRGRKPLFNADIFKERFDTIERVFGWEDKFRRLLLRFERLSQLHYAFKTLAYTMINLRHFC
jgi:transposase